ncbi:MAG: hypothetical protein WAL63_09415 [Solirubrobacteraceae bacterium]
MRHLALICATVAASALAASTALASGSYVLTATSSKPAAGYAPTFTGNGWLGIRVPPTGQGYAGGKQVPTQSEPGRVLRQAEPPQEARRRDPAAGQHPHLVEPDVHRRRHAVLAQTGHHHRPAAIDRPPYGLRSGAPLPVRTPSGTRTVIPGHSLTLATARPDLRPTADAVRCRAATATSAQPGAPALAAVDGSPATDWGPATLPADWSGSQRCEPRWCESGSREAPGTRSAAAPARAR